MKTMQLTTLFLALMLTFTLAQEHEKKESENKIPQKTNGNVVKTLESETHTIGFDAKIESKPETEKNGRNQILDSIFQIPIATLKAVNELVQNIAGNLQAAGAGTYFQKTSKVVVTDPHHKSNKDVVIDT